MGWLKKKKKQESNQEDSRKSQEVPELPKQPSLPKLPELPRLKNNKNRKIPSLPPLPKYPETEAIKHTINAPEAVLTPISDMTPSISTRHTTPIPITPEANQKQINQPHLMTSPPKTINEEPIFVKINKFKDAIENFDQVKEKVSDIEKMLREIKDIKAREDQELKEWENEIHLIKTKIQGIDNSLFEKVR